MKLNELLSVVEQGTKITVLNDKEEPLPLKVCREESRVLNIRNGIDCLVIQVE